MKGTVYFVGAGPGDAGLITVKGAQLLSRADCVIYDRLVNVELLQRTKKSCDRVYVGKPRPPDFQRRRGPAIHRKVKKAGDEGGRSQDAINRLLVEKARRYPKVVRLKGGDPTLFGRITEEIEALLKAGIRYEIVPGVSSAWAAAALAGIPLTDRRFSSSVAIVTGQRAVVRPPLAAATGQEAQGKSRLWRDPAFLNKKVRGAGKPAVRWKELSRGVDTIVILMGRANLPNIVKKLRKAGRSGTTPVALIRWASTPKQEILVSSLSRIEADLKRCPSLTPPVVVVIGEVAKLAARLKPQTLKGKRILVTRPDGDQEGLNRKLEALGAKCVNLPTISIRPRRLSKLEAQKLLKALPRYDWVLFTSHHGVENLKKLVRRSGRRLNKLLRAKICAIGPRTLGAVRQAGLAADLVPGEFSTAGIRKAFRKISVAGQKVFIPRSNLGVRDALAQDLRKRGARVDEVVLYETKWVEISPKRIKQALRGLDAATFTSASTVKGFLEAVRRAQVPLDSAINGTKVVAIGPATAQALQEGGISKFQLPKDSWTVEGLVGALEEALKV